MSFTPGPWKINSACIPDNRYGSWIDIDDICSVKVGYDSSEDFPAPSEEEYSNARLIAAAPDLFSIIKLSQMFNDCIHGKVDKMVFSEFAKSLGWDGVQHMDHFISDRRRKVIVEVEGTTSS